MGATPRREVTRRREELAWDLRLRGYKLAEIADRVAADGLGAMTPQAVHAALARTERRVLAGLTDRATNEKVRQLAALNVLYDEAMQAWERSKEPARSARSKVTQGPAAPADPPAGDAAEGAVARQRPADDRRTEMAQEVRERDGNPAFLAEARAALADLRRLLGLDAPRQVRMGGSPGAPPIAVAAAVRVEGVSRAEAEAVNALPLDRLRELDRQFREAPGVDRPADLADLGRDE